MESQLAAGDRIQRPEKQDGKREDLIVLSSWVRKELFATVKFLYKPEKDLVLGGSLYKMFVRDCKDRLVGLKLSTTSGKEYRKLYVESLWKEATQKKRNLVSEGINARRSSIYSGMQNRFTGE
jgi:hypothetical protein